MYEPFYDTLERQTLKQALARHVLPQRLTQVVRALEGNFGDDPDAIRSGAAEWLKSDEARKFRRPAAAVAFVDALRRQG
ncbi:MAG: hypothetical protein ABSB49_09805 [Polyangia bacterium]|jgi:hypothetical protein